MSIVTPGEGERRAQRGFVRQYEASAAAIYAALERDDLVWVGLADRGAGIADDIVLGSHSRVIGHQFKFAKYPGQFNLDTLFCGPDGVLRSLASAWQVLSASFPNQTVEIRFVTNDYPPNRDRLIAGPEGHSAAFLRELERFPTRSSAEWQSSRWSLWIDKLRGLSGLSHQTFEQFFHGLRVFSGGGSDFLLPHRLSPEGQRLAETISHLLPKLVADSRDQDRWTRAQLLKELGWRDSFALRRLHQFPIGTHVQRNVATEKALLNAVRESNSGYVALVGPPGCGKSTLLQKVPTAGHIVRYLAFLPGEGQGIGRAEADDFLDDVIVQLKRSGLGNLPFQDFTLQERRQQFENLLRRAGERFTVDGVPTIFVIDGLDHIPREEKPARSLLAELPLPSAVPDGVLFILGTQRIDLPDLKAAIQEQARRPERCVSVSPLSSTAICQMIDTLGLDVGIERDQIVKLCRGHPLVARYLIEALRNADDNGRERLLAEETAFEGEIESVYASAWRGISGDEARTVMGFIAHAEGAIEPELLALAVSERAVDQALTSTRHLLSLGQRGWSVFHNSFRLFILSQPQLKFGKNDTTYSRDVYRRLAEL